MKLALVNGAPTKRDASLAQFHRKRRERVIARCKRGKQVCYGGSITVWHDDSLAIRPLDVLIAHRREARIKATARFLQHSFVGFLAEVLRIIPRHQNLDAVDKLLA